jgi:hypothetical protein
VVVTSSGWNSPNRLVRRLVVLTVITVSAIVQAATAGATAAGQISAYPEIPFPLSGVGNVWHGHPQVKPSTWLMFADGSWVLVKLKWAGHLNYADLTACPSCSFGSAPRGTVEFVLTSVTNGKGTGSVTASSDPRTWALGAPVEVSLSAASPGQFLDVIIGGKQIINFCNSTSEGQCGA